MASGMWPSVSGAIAQSHVVDTVANNLANSDTIGFKKDAPAFKEYLATVEREKYPQDIQPGLIKNRDLYPLDGQDQVFTVLDGTYSNFRQGPLRVTQNPTDLALDGPGFFEVSTPAGVRLTRQGSFKVATDGRLVTAQGYPVLASNPGGLAVAQLTPAVQPSQGRPSTQGGVAAETTPQTAEVLARTINLRDAKGPVSINEAGELYVGNELLGQLAVTEVKDARQLRKVGGSLFANPDPQNLVEPNQPKQTRVVQGMVELSNVNPTEEMVNLIKANRLYEMNLKATKTYSDLMQKEATEVGKL